MRLLVALCIALKKPQHKLKKENHLHILFSRILSCHDTFFLQGSILLASMSEPECANKTFVPLISYAYQQQQGTEKPKLYL